jgi:hypothetical protein
MNKLILNANIKSNNLKLILQLNKRSLRLLSTSKTNLNTNKYEILHDLPKLSIQNYINGFLSNNSLVNFIKIQIKFEKPNGKKDNDAKSTDNDDKKNEENEKSNDNEKDPNEAAKKFFLFMVSSFIVYVTLYGLLVESTGQYEVPMISWQEFVNDMLATGEVEEISK